MLKTRSPATLTSGNTGLFLFEKGKKPTEECINYFQEFLLFDGEVIIAEPGIYTWALKQFGDDGPIRLLAAPALSKQEVGTLHANLDILTIPGKILIAGELQITADRTFIYNILSGTYSTRLPAKKQEEGMALFEEKLTALGASSIKKAGETGYGPIFEATNITLPLYAVKNYREICRMLWNPPHDKKRGGRRRTKRRGRRSLKRA